MNFDDIARVGDMVRMVTGQPNDWPNPRNTGLVVKIEHRPGLEGPSLLRIATVLTNSGGVVTWPLDSSNYDIRTLRASKVEAL